METYVVRAPGGLDRLEIVERDDSGEPGPGEVRVAIHATSLNFHDLLVANGGIPTEDGRVLVADGAGVVEAVGAGVAEFAPGDHVVSTFFQHWIAGRPFSAVGNFAGTPATGSTAWRLRMSCALFQPSPGRPRAGAIPKPRLSPPSGLPLGAPS